MVEKQLGEEAAQVSRGRGRPEARETPSTWGTWPGEGPLTAWAAGKRGAAGGLEKAGETRGERRRPPFPLWGRPRAPRGSRWPRPPPGPRSPCGQCPPLGRAAFRSSARPGMRLRWFHFLARWLALPYAATARLSGDADPAPARAPEARRGCRRPGRTPTAEDGGKWGAGCGRTEIRTCQRGDS